MLTNFNVNAGFAAARLRGDLVGLTVMAVVGYEPITIDEGKEHWRTGIVQQFQPDDFIPEIVLQFQWQDQEGEADLPVFQDDDIILLLTPDQLHLLKRFD